jgi:hypothetical protein
MSLQLPWGETFVNGGDDYWSKLGPGYQQAEGDIPRFATGTPDYSTNTPFGNFGTFTPQQLADSPVVKQLQGKKPVNQWQMYGGGANTMTLPGTNTQLPGAFNVTDFMANAPSARKMTQSLYETPRSMGGLGLHWEDILQASERAAPIGARLPMAQYGYG